MKTTKHSLISISTTVIMMFIVALKSFALDYNISFTGSKASSLVESVEVHNLTNGKSVIVPAGNVLNLSDAPNAVNTVYSNGEFINIYPNPIQGKSILSFYSNKAGDSQINIIAPDGRKLVGITNRLEEGENSFQLSLAKGAYIIKITGAGFSYSAKVISQTRRDNKPEITYLGNVKKNLSTLQKAKSAAATTLYYNEGDRLLYKGISGNYSTIVTDLPTGSKTVNFEFVECKDGFGNYYSTVKIGSQLWMVENLNTTKYLTGESIIEVKDDATWKSLTTGAYCDNNNSPDNSLTYGKLYNWYAVNDSRKIAPTGWHVPTNAEWISLSDYLGGASVAGAKLKETGTSHWGSPNNASNESGFSAFAGGLRTYDGTFLGSGGTLGSWWTATPVDATYSYSKRLSNTLGLLFQDSNRENQYGYSVRCIRDISTIPTLTTSALTAITQTTATGGGTITSDGGETVTARGICWSTTPTPTIDNSKTTDGTGTGTFASALTGLTNGMTYYVRSYATNSIGTSYGNEVSFTALASLPTLTTTSTSAITTTSATSGGNITNDGGATITARGVCWSTTTAPTTANSKTIDGTGTGIFASEITGLNPNTKYYIRSYAANSAGTSYGNEVSFTTATPITVPILNTTAATSILYSSAISGGNITSDGGATVTERGVCWSMLANPTIADSKTSNGTGTGTFTSSITGLLPNTKYYVRAYATNSVGISYGTQVSFTTTTSIATLTTIAATNITQFTATSGGTVSADGGATITARGVCWSTTNNPTVALTTKTVDGTGRGAFTSSITGLALGTTYYVRAYATNSVGTAYGNEITFTTVGPILPTISTSTVTSITTTSATSGGNITSDGGGTVLASGVCWSTSPNPTLSNSYTNEGSGTGLFSSLITELSLYTTYYVRAYATNIAGTAYGTQVSFTTLGNDWNFSNTPFGATPTVNFASTFAFSGLTVGTDGINLWTLTANTKIIDGTTYTYRLQTGGSGIPVAPSKIPTTRYLSFNVTGACTINIGCMSSSSTATRTLIIVNSDQSVLDSIVNISGTVASNYSFNYNGGASTIYLYSRSSGLNFYYLKYSNQQTLPTLSTTEISSITTSSATSGGNISSDSGTAVTARGICWGTSSSPTIANSFTSDGTGIGLYTSSLTGLTAGSTYYVRAYATNSAGTSYGNEVSFTTSNPISTPILSTTAISTITSSTAIGGGIITSDSGASVTARGVCWSTTTNPTITNNFTSDGTGTGSFTSSLTGLTAVTTYYVRAYATNSSGTSYGNEVSFTTVNNTKNLLLNPGFETWSGGVPTDWTLTTTAGGVITQSTTTVSGTGSAYQLAAGPTGTNMASQNVLPPDGASTFDTNKTYKFSVKYLVKAGDGTDARVWSNFVTSAVGVTPATYFAVPASRTDSVNNYNSFHGPGGNKNPVAGVSGDDFNGYLLDNRTSGVWHTYAFLFKFPAGITQFSFMIRSYSNSTVIWDDLFLGEYDGLEPTIPVMGTNPISNITTTGALSGGYFVNDGNAAITTRGVCWSTSTSPTIANSKTSDGSGSGTYTSTILGLTANTKYYVRAYATNSVGTCYGDEQSFTTNASVTVPTISTTAISAITTTTATSGGNITSDGGATVTARGICWSTTTNPTIANSKTTDGTGTGLFTSSLTGLTAGTTYYIRAYATNSVGTSYGNEVSFTNAIPITPPILTTTAISAVTTTTATSGGNITSNGGATVTARGVCWSTSSAPTISNSKTSDVTTGTGTFTSSMTGLSPNTSYYVRAYATNSIGTSYGNEVSFTNYDVMDIDGNGYHSITIGTQVWMDENLKTTKYRDGTNIPNVTDSLVWYNTTTDAYCEFENNPTYANMYGKLYNWYAVSNSRNLAPIGWHVPTDEEWTILTDFLGGLPIAGGKLKEMGTEHWLTPNMDATNEVGFTALPGGDRWGSGHYNGKNKNAYFWTSTQYTTPDNSWYRALVYNNKFVNRNFTINKNALSIRCIKNAAYLLPSIETSAITTITTNTATSGGTITSDGGATITARGVCWSTSSSPTITNSKTTDGIGTGTFTSSLTGLTAGTTYYLRAYATNSAGTGYGNEQVFTTFIVNISTSLIPAGTFIMGSPITEVGRSTDETQYSVTLSAFRMSKYEITNAQYAAFLNAKSIGSNGIWSTAPTYPTQTLIYSSGTSYDWGLKYSGTQWVPVAGYENAPVINVCWYGAAEFATYVGGSLPTEAQWEYACRGGTTTPFNTGDFLTNLQANYNWVSPYNGGTNTVTTYPGKTLPVGTYAPNGYGLYDMHGNVWEWCADWYDTYPTSDQTNPIGASTGLYRVIRGGRWFNYAKDCRSAYRYKNYPYTDYNSIGFRVVFVP